MQIVFALTVEKCQKYLHFSDFQIVIKIDLFILQMRYSGGI